MAVSNLIWLLIVVLIVLAIFSYPRAPASAPATYSPNWYPFGSIGGVIVLLILLRIFGVI
jgi:uncharacterized membrane protein